MGENTERARLRWGCRRGMLELDLFLMPFFDDQFDSLSSEQQADFAQLLAEPDTELFAWFMGQTQAEHPPFVALCRLIREHANATRAAESLV